jgi:hypothetical protein
MALAFYPLVAWRAWLMPPAPEGKAWCDGRRAESRAPSTAARGAAIPPGDRQRCRFGGAWSKSERAIIVVQKEACVRYRARPGG